MQAVKAAEATTAHCTDMCADPNGITSTYEYTSKVFVNSNISIRDSYINYIGAIATSSDIYDCACQRREGNGKTASQRTTGMRTIMSSIETAGQTGAARNGILHAVRIATC
jgi:hypothetical protein